MKKVLSLIFLLLATAAFAQTSTTTANPFSACGPEAASFKVTVSDDVSIPEPPSGMATLVFVEDQLRLRPGHAICLRCANQIKLGMDGQWIAANSGVSHTAISILPGEHHFCALPEPSLTGDSQPSMYGMQVEAAKAYHLRGRLGIYEETATPIFDLSLMNEDEGRFMVATSKRSQSVLK